LQQHQDKLLICPCDGHETFAAYQYGVPTKELAGEAMDAEPKSASFTWPGSVSKTLPALMSLWETKGREGEITASRHMQLSHCSAWLPVVPLAPRADKAYR
jgi:uncharacterized membrane-anchored protein